MSAEAMPRVPPPSAAAEAGFLGFSANLVAALIHSEEESVLRMSDSANGDPGGLTDPARLRLMRGDVGGTTPMLPLVEALPGPVYKKKTGS